MDTTDTTDTTDTGDSLSRVQWQQTLDPPYNILAPLLNLSLDPPITPAPKDNPQLSPLQATTSGYEQTSSPKPSMPSPLSSDLPTSPDNASPTPSSLPDVYDEPAPSRQSPGPQQPPVQQQQQGHQQEQQHLQYLQRPSPHPIRPSALSPRGRSKSQLMTDVSGADLTSAAPSTSPSSWSATSSSTDTVPSPASSVMESKTRFERLPNG
ncbi:hypothetical protein BGZ65_012785, partial [Modicella reniformis]